MGYLSAMLSLHHLPLSLLQVLPYFFIAINPTLSLSSLSLSNIFSIYAYTLFKLFHHTIMEQLTKLVKLFFILLAFTFASQLMQVNETEARVLESSERDQRIKGGNEAWRMRKSWRAMIGSTAPSCTYNECKGCKYKCRAELVPVEGNDPINSPYHYRCVCHR
ncbi:hypothetical protein ACSQ67_020694 [Phaseolus vulgaris]